MNPFQLTFTLRQHTPIIHFQHEQAGATLRATELKPKLDRFIMERLLRENGIPYNEYRQIEGKNCYVNVSEAFRIATVDPENPISETWAGWLVGGRRAGHVALNYSLIVRDNDPRPISQRSFGNVKLITDVLPDKRGVSSNSISITITCMLESLRQTIDTHIRAFFLVENFGNRQNKGWGSFTHEAHSTWDEVKHELLRIGQPCYVCLNPISFKGRESEFNNFYPKVSTYWKRLKSGINLLDKQGNQVEYSKSLLFRYLCSNGLRWDKRWMKQRLETMIARGVLPANLLGNQYPNDCYNGVETDFGDKESTNEWEDDPILGYDYVFGRAMLGLAEHIEFRAEQRYIYQVIIRNSNGIERFKAPVTFKFYGDRLFALATDCTPMLGQTFHFEVQVKQKPPGGGSPIAVGEPVPIRNREGELFRLGTPKSASEFELSTFLDTFFPRIGFSKLTTQSIEKL